MTGYDVAKHLMHMISPRVRRLLFNEMFRSRCEIKPAIKKLEQDVINLQNEINQNENAIKFLKSFKESSDE